MEIGMQVFSARLRLVAVLSVAGGCGFLKDAAKEEVQQEIQKAGQGDVPTDPGVPPVDEAKIDINSVQPGRSSNLGGIPVEIIGTNFPADARVMFGFAEATAVQVLSDTRIQCIVPQSSATEPLYVGPVNVRVLGADSTGMLEAGFEYFEPVRITEVSPTRGPSEGGTAVTVTGTGFVGNTDVRFGSSAPVHAAVFDDTTLLVTAPPLPRGTYGVTVINGNGNASLAAAFSTYDRVRVQDVTPFAGPLLGGTAVVVTGRGFVSGTTLHFGLQELTATASLDESQLLATTLAAPAGTSEGPVDVVADTLTGKSTLRDGFVYFDSTNTTSRVIAVIPSAALTSGGEVKVAGVGLDDGTTTATFGGTPGSCTVIDTNMMTCTVPPASEGTVNLNVVNNSINDTRAFNYVDLRIDLVSPAKGAIAGGTFLQIFGNGFDTDAEVYVGGRPVSAGDVTVVSGTELTVRTPPGEIGPAEVRVLTRNIEIARSDLFTYFDPADYAHWSSGGRIDGAVNVTVVDYESFQPVENAFVLIGADATGAPEHYKGFTDARGQLTLSGPDVFGPLSVHAAKVGYGAFSWLDVDAENLTLTLAKHPELPPYPPPECPNGQGEPPPPPPGPGRAIVRGNVYRVKDEFNTGRDTVVVSTSRPSLFAPLPDAGPKAVLGNQGPYEAFVRVGDLVLVASAGSIDASGRFTANAVGFRPFVYTERSSELECTEDAMCEVDEQCVFASPTNETGTCFRVYEGMDIIIDTPLAHQMEVDLVDPPLGIPSIPYFASPNLAFTMVWYDFGSMGTWSIGTSASGTSTSTFRMPKAMPESLANRPFNVVAQVYGSTSSGGDTWSTVWSMGHMDTMGPILLDPVLKALHELAPTADENVGSPMHLEVEQLPASSSAPPPSAIMHQMYDVVQPILCIHPVFGPIPVPQPLTIFYWMALAPGTSSAYDLPVFDAATVGGANLPSGLHGWQMSGWYLPSSDFNNLDFESLYYGSMQETGRATTISK